MGDGRYTYFSNREDTYFSRYHKATSYNVVEHDKSPHQHKWQKQMVPGLGGEMPRPKPTRNSCSIGALHHRGTSEPPRQFNAI